MGDMIVKSARISAGRGNETMLADIVVSNGKIADILPAGAVPASNGWDTIDASGMTVLPGAVDPHVHFDTPGYTHREDFEHGTKSAAAGGVTCIIDMPDTSVPPVIGAHEFEEKLAVISEMAVIDFALWGGMSGNSFHTCGWKRRVRELIDCGVVGIKSYLLSGMRTFEHLQPLEMLEFMQEAAVRGVPVGVHAEDRASVLRRTAALQTASRMDPAAYYESRADPAERDGISAALEMAKAVECPLHIVHVASGAGADLLSRAKSDGFDVTFETCPHYLEFTKDDLERRGSVVKTAPVVKTAQDRERLWKFINDGSIDFIASDHAPCPVSEKLTGSIWTDYAGMPGTELLLPYLFSEGYMKGRMDLARLIELTSGNAAKRFGLYGRKGALNTGFDADLVIIDTGAKRTVFGSELQSKGSITAFEGMTFAGRVIKTLCRGKVIYDVEDGILANVGYGRFLRAVR